MVGELLKAHGAVLDLAMDVSVLKKFIAMDSTEIGMESEKLRRACQENLLVKALLTERLAEASKSVVEMKLKKSIEDLVSSDVLDGDTILDAKADFLADVAGDYQTPKIKEALAVWYRGVRVDVKAIR